MPESAPPEPVAVATPTLGERLCALIEAVEFASPTELAAAQRRMKDLYTNLGVRSSYRLIARMLHGVIATYGA